MKTKITEGAGWIYWKKCSGVLCERRMPSILEGNDYRPAMLYGADMWAITKSTSKKDEGKRNDDTNVDLRSATKHYIRNEYVRGAGDDSDTNFKKDHGDTIEFVRDCDGER